MSIMVDIQTLYQDYFQQFDQQEQARTLGEGMFGLGMGPRDYPCHRQFSQALEQLLETIAKQQPETEQVQEILTYIYCAPLELAPRENAVYWMLLAVHGLTFPLIPYLTAADAKVLYNHYKISFPRRNRLPTQDKVLAALQSRGNQA